MKSSRFFTMGVGSACGSGMFAMEAAMEGAMEGAMISVTVMHSVCRGLALDGEKGMPGEWEIGEIRAKACEKSTQGSKNSFVVLSTDRCSSALKCPTSRAAQESYLFLCSSIRMGSGALGPLDFSASLSKFCRPWETSTNREKNYLTAKNIFSFQQSFKSINQSFVHCGFQRPDEPSRKRAVIESEIQRNGMGYGEIFSERSRKTIVEKLSPRHRSILNWLRNKNNFLSIFVCLYCGIFIHLVPRGLGGP